MAGAAGGVEGAGDLGFGSPAWRAAAASSLRSAAGSASSARLAAQNRPALRLPSGWAATQRTSAGDPVVGQGAGGWLLVLAVGFQQPDDGLPVQPGLAVEGPDALVGPAADLDGGAST